MIGRRKSRLRWERKRRTEEEEEERGEYSICIIIEYNINKEMEDPTRIL